MIKLRFLFVAVIGLSCLTGPAHAQSAWVKRCEGAQCEIVQILMDQQSNSRVMEAAIGFPSGKTEARLVLILPLGVDLSQSFSLSIDDGVPLGFKVRYCLVDGCYAFLTLPPDVIAMMKNGSMAALSFRTYDGNPARLPLTLEGFSAAVTGIQK